MKQFTKEQAITFYESDIWKNWDDEKIVKFQLFQKRVVIPFDYFHQAINTVLNRLVFTHEFALNYNDLIDEYLNIKPEPTFQEIIEIIPEEKRIIIDIIN